MDPQAHLLFVESRNTSYIESNKSMAKDILNNHSDLTKEGYVCIVNLLSKYFISINSVNAEKIKYYIQENNGYDLGVIWKLTKFNDTWYIVLPTEVGSCDYCMGCTLSYYQELIDTIDTRYVCFKDYDELESYYKNKYTRVEFCDHDRLLELIE